jgi:rhomboid protease GluP
MPRLATRDKPVTSPPEASPPPSQPRHLSLPMAQPRVTYIILAINVLVFLAMTAAGGSTNSAVLIRFGAKANVLIAQGQIWRLLTSIFLHVGPMHLFFNSYALFVFGVEVERVYGSARFLIIYLLAGLYGSLVSFAIGPPLSAGASGAIFGLLGVMVAYLRRHRETFGEWGRQRLMSLLGVAGFNLVLGFTVPGIDNLAHLGGLVSGAALGWLLAPEYQLKIDERGLPYVADRTSLRSRWWMVTLAVLVLIAGTSLAITAHQGSVSSLIMRGQRAFEDGDVAGAESFFRQAVTREPDSALAHFYLGVAFSEQEEMSEAIEAYQNAVRLEPDLAEAHWNLALTYATLNRAAEAIAEFEAFVALRPDSSEADEARTYITELQESIP